MSPITNQRSQIQQSDQSASTVEHDCRQSHSGAAYPVSPILHEEFEISPSSSCEPKEFEGEVEREEEEKEENALERDSPREPDTTADPSNLTKHPLALTYDEYARKLELLRLKRAEDTGKYVCGLCD